MTTAESTAAKAAAFEKLRTQQIVLDMPMEGQAVWVRIAVQKIIKTDDYATLQTIDRAIGINRQFEQYQEQVHTFTDPVLGTTHTLSGSGLAKAITEFVIGWMLTDIDGVTRNARGDVIKPI